MRVRNVWYSLLILAVFGLSACKLNKADLPVATRTTLNVFAAASLTESFRGLGKRFETAHPAVIVVFNFAGSQQLREQLSHGAPADLFASANRKEMDGAVSASLVDRATIQTFARNTLVVIFPKDNPAKIGTLADLARSGIKLDVADPAVPAGKYTVQMLDQMTRNAAFGPEFKTKVLANVVSREDNVKAVVNKVRLGEVDAGVVYVTDVTGEAAKEIGVLPVPDAFNQTAEYPIAVTTNATEAESAKQFEGYVLSAEGQQILMSYGFLPATAISATTTPTTTP